MATSGVTDLDKSTSGSGPDPALTARVANLEGKYVRTTRFAGIGSGTSGPVTLPPSSSVVLDDFGGTVDAVVCTMSGGRPTYTAALDSGGVAVGTTFDSSGNYVLSGTPTAYPVAIVYRVQQQLKDFDSAASDIVGPPQIIDYNVFVKKTGDMMSGQLIFPSWKLKSGVHELLAQWDGSNNFVFDSTSNISDGIGFNAGDVMYFNAAGQMQFNVTVAGSGMTFDSFGGITQVASSGRNISLQTSSGGITEISDLSVNSGLGAGPLHIYNDSTNNRSVIETGAPVNLLLSNSNATVEMTSGDAILTSLIYGNSFNISGDGSATLLTKNGGSFLVDISGAISQYFGMSGEDFTIVNAQYGSAVLTFSGTGETLLNSTHGENVSITGYADIALYSSTSGNVVADMNIVPSRDNNYSIGDPSLNWQFGYFEVLNFGGITTVDLKNGQLLDTSGAGVSVDFHNRNNVVFATDVTTGGDYYGGVFRGLNIQLTGANGAGLIEVLAQNPAPSVPAGGSLRFYSNNSDYPTFLDSSNRSVTFSMNSISLNTNVELTIPNTTGVIATQAYVTSNSVQQANTIFSQFPSAAATLNITNTQFYVFTGTVATWSLGATPTAGKWHTVKNRGTGILTINVTGGGATIYSTAAVTSVTIAAGSSLNFKGDGTYWCTV